MNISDQTVLENLCLESTGDVRSAVNSLQFLLLPGQESTQCLHDHTKFCFIALISTNPIGLILAIRKETVDYEKRETFYFIG